jgi:hypothetical protein
MTPYKAARMLNRTARLLVFAYCKGEIGMDELRNGLETLTRGVAHFNLDLDAVLALKPPPKLARNHPELKAALRAIVAELK